MLEQPTHIIDPEPEIPTGILSFLPVTGLTIGVGSIIEMWLVNEIIPMRLESIDGGTVTFKRATTEQFERYMSLSQ